MILLGKETCFFICWSLLYSQAWKENDYTEDLTQTFLG